MIAVWSIRIGRPSNQPTGGPASQRESGKALSVFLNAKNTRTQDKLTDTILSCLLEVWLVALKAIKSAYLKQQQQRIIERGKKKKKLEFYVSQKHKTENNNNYNYNNRSESINLHSSRSTSWPSTISQRCKLIISFAYLVSKLSSIVYLVAAFC